MPIFFFLFIKIKNVVRFGSDPETGSRGGKIVDKNNNIVVALEDYRGSIVTAEIFKGKYFK